MTAKDLKNALLQEAVQGKLVPQIASEGNARDLLEEIRKERLSHGLDFANAKSGKKSKKETALAGSNLCDIPEEEIPFDIPESWCWCRLGEICTFENGDRSSNYPVEIDYTSDGIPFFGAADMKNNKLLFSDNLRFISKEKFDSLRSGKLQNKDYVMLLRGAVGKWAQFLNQEKYYTGFINAQMVIIRAYESIVEYIKVLFNSPIFESFLRSKTTGTAVAQMSAKDLSSLLVPLPPLSEQKRIVAAIEKFMPLIEEYGKKESVINELNAQIGTLTKKAILQEAVQGKLVPQIPAEGSAKDLLEQIKAQKATLIKEGKIKKEKPLPEITEDEIPFDIPENWCWCRLGEVVDTNIGLTYSPTDIVTDGGTSVLRSNNIQNGKIVYDDLVHVSKKVPEKCLSRKGDLLICARNGSKALVGKSALIEQDGMAFGAFMALVRSPINPYILYFINSPVYRSKLEGVNTTTINQITQDNLRETLFPLPPLAEQKRIVEAIEKMLPICEKLGK